MDSAAWVTVGSVLTAIIAGTTAYAVARLNAKNEKANAVDDGVEMTLRERIVLKEEIIMLRDATISGLIEKVALYKSLYQQEKTKNEDVSHT